ESARRGASWRRAPIRQPPCARHRRATAAEKAARARNRAPPHRQSHPLRVDSTERRGYRSHASVPGPDPSLNAPARPQRHSIDSTKETRLRQLAALLAVTAMCLTIANHAAAEPAKGSRAPSAVDTTALVPPGGSSVAYATPADQALALSRFCADACVRCS